MKNVNSVSCRADDMLILSRIQGPVGGGEAGDAHRGKLRESRKTKLTLKELTKAGGRKSRKAAGVGVREVLGFAEREREQKRRVEVTECVSFMALHALSQTHRGGRP